MDPGILWYPQSCRGRRLWPLSRLDRSNSAWRHLYPGFATDQLEWDHLVRMGPRERGLAMNEDFRDTLVDAWYSVHNLFGEGLAMLSLWGINK